MKEFKCFLLTDYEDEEIYLREKHKSGYKLVKISLPGIYKFEECAPEDYVYRLDFNPQKKEDKDAYIQMFVDYGWEYMQDMNEFSYFRKKADLSNEDENHIFCDNESKMDMLKRIIKMRYLPIILISICCMLLCINTMNVDTPLKSIFIIYFGIIIGILVTIFVRVYVGYIRLKNKYEKEIK